LLLAFNKPFGVLSQFTGDGSPNRTLADFSFPADVYPLGRLDADSEGLLLLCDEPGLNTKLLAPENSHWRTYWAQVEGIPDTGSLAALTEGVVIQGHRTRPARVKMLEKPDVPPRIPPIRFRKNVPDCWIELELVEGRNRQVAGTWKKLTDSERQEVFASTSKR
jgi:23S rRNA pseudouridine2457 synthase